MPRYTAEPTPHKLHVPLSSELHAWLKEESRRTGQPATLLARQALERMRDALEHEQKKAELRAYVEAHAGTELDRDPQWSEAASAFQYARWQEEQEQAEEAEASSAAR